MDVTSIEKFLTNHVKNSGTVNVHFKDRSTITGIFINTRDYDELKSKNFWRVVNLKNIAQWEQTQDLSISRIFNGAAFTRLSSSAK